jgi:hypothetical protein
VTVVADHAVAINHQLTGSSSSNGGNSGRWNVKQSCTNRRPFATPDGRAELRDVESADVGVALLDGFQQFDRAHHDLGEAVIFGERELRSVERDELAVQRGCG